MAANKRITRTMEDVALELALITRGTEHEQMARANHHNVRWAAGVLRMIESWARDGRPTGNVLAEYGDVLSFGPPIDDNNEAA